jgi:hypothetical protein
MAWSCYLSMAKRRRMAWTLLGRHGPPCLVGMPSKFSRSAIAATLSRGLPLAFRRNCRIRSRLAASLARDPNGFLPSHRPSRRRIRSLAARSFSTITDFSNCATAPSTWRISVRVGSPSAVVRSAPSAVSTRAPSRVSWSTMISLIMRSRARRSARSTTTTRRVSFKRPVGAMAPSDCDSSWGLTSLLLPSPSRVTPRQRLTLGRRVFGDRQPSLEVGLHGLDIRKDTLSPWLRVLSVFVAHYNGHRPHPALTLTPPCPTRPVLAPVTAWGEARVQRRDRLGGVVREYVCDGLNGFCTLHPLWHAFLFLAALSGPARGQLSPGLCGSHGDRQAGPRMRGEGVARPGRCLPS